MHTERVNAQDMIGAYPEIFLGGSKIFFSSYTQVIVLFVNSNDTRMIN